MSEEKKPILGVKVIKNEKHNNPAPVKEVENNQVQAPEKKIVVKMKRVVTVKARVKEMPKQEQGPKKNETLAPTVLSEENKPKLGIIKTPQGQNLPPITRPIPRQANNSSAAQSTPVESVQPSAATPAPQAPVRQKVIRPRIPVATNTNASQNAIPSANRVLVGGERLSSTLHNGPVVIRPNNLPPVPGQKDTTSPTAPTRPRVAGVVGGRPTQRPPRPQGTGTGRPHFPPRDGANTGYRPYNANGPSSRYPRQGGAFIPEGQRRPGGFTPRPSFGNRPGFGGPRPAFGNRTGFGPRPGFGGPRPQNGAGGSGNTLELNQKSAAKKFTGKKKEGSDYHSRRDAEIDFQFQQKKKEESKLASIPKSIDIMENITVSDLAKKMNLKASDIITKLFKMGMMVTINQQIDKDTAEIICGEYGCEVHLVSLYDETTIEEEPENPEDLQPRAPIVTIMGHVDHGKTKLLDAIRSSNVAGGEFGGITQHIGAYKVAVPGKGNVVFLDTPGHAAFSMMRARGAQVTDIVVLVVAANDGVMPQTREAIDHAKAAKVPIIVAINKCDLPEAKPDRVMQQLTDLGLMPEEWGGTTLYCQISALKKIGIEELLDTILLQAEILELKANPNCRAVGKVLESRIDQGRGTVATVLIEKGTLRQGDYYVAGIYPGRVRAMFDDKGKKIKSAGPSDPVEIIGLSNIPSAGDPFQVTEDEKQARMVGTKRQELERLGAGNGNNKVTLENLYDKIKEGEVQEFNVVIKGDVQGSVEALQGELEKLSTPEIRLSVLRASAGAIIESDVTLASASNAMIIGFNVRPTPRALALAEQEKVEIKKYNIIYDVVDDIKAAMEGMLSPEIKENDIGKVEVRETFRVPKIGLIAGCYVLDGKVKRNSLVRVIRDSIQINKDMVKINSLKRFKDDAKEVTMGYECGIGLENFQDLQTGDILEIVETEEVKRTLEDTNK